MSMNDEARTEGDPGPLQDAERRIDDAREAAAGLDQTRDDPEPAPADGWDDEELED